jgi:tryptophanase
VVSSAQQESTPLGQEVEVGSLMFGRAGEPWPLEMTRLAIPRRAYTESQLCYVAAVLADMYVVATRSLDCD